MKINDLISSKSLMPKLMLIINIDDAFIQLK